MFPPLIFLYFRSHRLIILLTGLDLIRLTTDLCGRWVRPCRSWSRPGSSRCRCTHRSDRGRRWGQRGSILGHRTQMWSGCSRRAAHHPATDQSTINMVFSITQPGCNWNEKRSLEDILALKKHHRWQFSQTSHLKPQNIWVWFPFNHNSQTARLPDVHVHILHDGFKLGRHYGRRKRMKKNIKGGHLSHEWLRVLWSPVFSQNPRICQLVRKVSYHRNYDWFFKFMMYWTNNVLQTLSHEQDPLKRETRTREIVCCGSKNVNSSICFALGGTIFFQYWLYLSPLKMFFYSNLLLTFMALRKGMSSL